MPATSVSEAPAAGTATNASEAPRLNARSPLNIKARLDDGRYKGFHQEGGDQPAGDQQFRPVPSTVKTK